MRLSIVFLFVVFANSNARTISNREKLRFNVTSQTDEYLPCKTEVNVYYDISSDISPTTYHNLQLFLDNHIFAASQFNHFERLGLSVFADWVTIPEPDSFHNRDDVYYFIDETGQRNRSADLEGLFSALLDDFDDPSEQTGLSQSIVILVGKFDVSDAKAVDQYTEQLHKAGIHLGMIGIQERVKVENLQRVADFSFVVDVNKEVPANIGDLLKKVHGC